MQGNLTLLHHIACNPSLFVSIPALHCWTRLLRSRAIQKAPFFVPMAGQLMALCSSRLIKYEQFPEDSEDVTILFLHEDLDTIPERHAFLGNYRRYCSDIIDTIVRAIPTEAISLILSRATEAFQNLYSGQPPFRRECPIQIGRAHV